MLCASKGSGKKQDSEVVCWYCEKKGHRASDCRKKQRDNDSGKSTGFKRGDSRGKSNKETFKGKCYKCGKTGHRSKECRSKETSAFEAGDELAETGCIDMASVDLNALDIGAVQLTEKDHRIRIGVDSCAAVTVFPKSVADDYPMLDTSGKATSYRPASGKLLPDLGARKVQAQRRVSQIREPESCGHAQGVDGGVRDERHGTRCLLPKERQRHQGVRVPREQWYETGARESERSVRVASRTCPIQPEYIEEQHIRFVFFTSALEQIKEGYDCGPPKLTGACNAVRPTKEALLQPLVSVGGSSGSRDVIYPIPGGALLGERPVVPGGRERTEREEQLQRHIEGDAAQGPVVKAKKAPSAPSLDEWDGHLAAGHAEY